MNKWIDCIVHLFPVYVWFSVKGEHLLDRGRLIQPCQIREALIRERAFLRSFMVKTEN